jgi:hypothetical protein
MDGARPFVIAILVQEGLDINALNDAGEAGLTLAAWYR